MLELSSHAIANARLLGRLKTVIFILYFFFLFLWYTGALLFIEICDDDNSAFRISKFIFIFFIPVRKINETHEVSSV